jgi:hypothetical protein
MQYHQQDDQKKFEETIQQHQDTPIDEQTQSRLNQPFSNASSSLSADDKAFLENLIKRVESGEIELHTPGTIMNQEVYDQLPSAKKAEADLFVNSTLFVIRQVYDFYHSDFENNSDMMQNMVQELRMKKEMLEKDMGDVLKI